MKRISNQEITCAALADLFTTYVEAFNTAELPEVSTIFQATAKVNYDAVRQSALASYRDAMRRVAGPGQPHIAEGDLERAHDRAYEDAMAHFEDAKLLGLGLLVLYVVCVRACMLCCLWYVWCVCVCWGTCAHVGTVSVTLSLCHSVSVSPSLSLCLPFTHTHTHTLVWTANRHGCKKG